SMRYALLALLVPSVAAAGERNEAEKLFRDLEKKVAKAKTVRVAFAAQVTLGKEGEGDVKGLVALAEGNKGRVELKGRMFGKEESALIVADGKTLTESEQPSGKKKERPVPRNFGVMLRKATALGPGTSLLIVFLTRSGGPRTEEDKGKPGKEAEPWPLDELNRLQLSDFKLGKDTKVGGRAARVLQYSMSVPGGKIKLPTKLWLDARTHLPVKRELNWKEGEKGLRIVETYSEFQLDAKADGKAPGGPR